MTWAPSEPCPHGGMNAGGGDEAAIGRHLSSSAPFTLFNLQPELDATSPDWGDDDIPTYVDWRRTSSKMRKLTSLQDYKLTSLQAYKLTCSQAIKLTI